MKFYEERAPVIPTRLDAPIRRRNFCSATFDSSESSRRSVTSAPNLTMGTKLDPTASATVIPKPYSVASAPASAPKSAPTTPSKMDLLLATAKMNLPHPSEGSHLPLKKRPRLAHNDSLADGEPSHQLVQPYGHSLTSGMCSRVDKPKSLMR